LLCTELKFGTLVDVYSL